VGGRRVGILLADIKRKGKGSVVGRLISTGVLGHTLEKRPKRISVEIIVADGILSVQRPNFKGRSAGSTGICYQRPKETKCPGTVFSALVIEREKQEKVVVHAITSMSVTIKGEKPPIILAEV
jgi:hypothetical protein